MAALPTWAFVVWPLTFVFGVFIGRYQERHKEKMTMRSVANAYKTWYYKWAPMVATGIAVLALIGIWIATSATIVNGRQDAAADEANRKVQACFDAYASAQSASSSAVREASVIKDAATEKFNQALNAEGRAFKVVVAKILADEVTPADVQRLYDTLDARDRAGAAVEEAQAKLDKAREDNPVPPAPSEFCSVQP